MKTKIIWIFLLSLMGTFTGCLKDVEVDVEDAMVVDKPKYFEMKVVNVDLTAKKIMEMAGTDSIEFIKVGDGTKYDLGLLYANLNTSIDTSYNALEISAIQDKDVSQNYNMPSAGIQTDYVFKSPPVNPSPDQKIYSMDFIGGTLYLGITFPTGYTGTAVVTVPGMKYKASGLAFSKTYDLSISSKQEEQINLNEVVLGFDQATDSSYVTVNLQLEVTANNSGGSGQQMVLDFKLNSLQPKTIKGYFGTMQLLNQKIEQNLDFFQQFKPGQVELKEIRMDIDVWNYIGIPLGIVIDSGVFTKTTTGDVGKLDPINLKIAASTTPGDSANSKLIVDASNSNLTQVMSIFPDDISINLRALLNPDDNKSDTNFVTDVNRLRANVDLSVPLWFWANKFNYQDTMDFDFPGTFGDSSVIKGIKRAAIDLSVENGLPFAINLQAYFTDSTFKVVDSLFTSKDGLSLFAGGTLDANDRLSSPGKSNPSIALTGTLIDKLAANNATKVIYSLRISTAESEENPKKFVKFFDDYYLKMSMSISAETSEIDLNN